MEWMPIRVLLYQAGIDGKVLDNMIASWTWLWNAIRRRRLTEVQREMLRHWSHAELWTPDESHHEGHEEHEELKNLFVQDGQFLGTCWTSTMGAIRDPKSKEGNGTVCRAAATVLRNPQRWSVSEDLWIPRLVYEDLIDYMTGKVQNNAGYDKRAILSFGTPWRFHRKNQEICSEHVHDDLMYIAKIWQYKNVLQKTTKYESKSDYLRLINYMQFYSQTDVPSPLLLGINLIRAGVRFGEMEEIEVRSQKSEGRR